MPRLPASDPARASLHILPGSYAYPVQQAGLSDHASTEPSGREAARPGVVWASGGACTAALAARPCSRGGSPPGQLAGEEAECEGCELVNERCLAMAVRKDGDLNRLLAGHVRNGGAMPGTLLEIASAAKGRERGSLYRSEFDASFVALLRKAPPMVPAGRFRYSVAVDPRDGLHYALRHANGGEDTDEDESAGEMRKYEGGGKLFAVPHLDACGAPPAALRRAAARDALPRGTRDVLDAELGQAAADPSLAARERLRRVRQESRRTDACLEEGAFRHLVLELSRWPRDQEEGGCSEAGVELVWSGEALQALQTAAEAGLLALCRAALHTAVHCGGRAMLEPKDVSCVLQTWLEFA